MASLTTAQYFRKLIDEPWGFETAERTAFYATFQERFFADSQAKGRAIEATLAQLRALPGVSAATATAPSPMNAPRNLFGFNPEGAAVPEPRGYYLAYSARDRAGIFQDGRSTAAAWT